MFPKQCYLILAEWLSTRDVDDMLLKWKNGRNRKPLLTRGVRQVGKSAAVKHLGETFEN